jgi:adenosine deaminase
LTEQRVEQLAAAAGVDMLRPLGELYRFRALPDFLDTYEWWCKLLRSTEIAEQLAYDTALLMREQGIVYAELLTGPRYWSYLRYDELIRALDHGFERAQGDGGTDCRLVPSISREQPAEWAMELVEWLGAGHAPRVVGIGLDGNEAVLGRTSPNFEAAFNRAGELGLGRTAHAGESSGPEGVRDGLDYLGLDRVDHGVRAIEDPALVRRLAEQSVTLNVCPTCNVMLGMYPTLEQHPVGRLLDAGVPTTINTDDPVPLGLNLTGELLQVGNTLGWAVADIVQATRTAIDAAFCGEARKRALHTELHAHLTA